MGEKFKLFDEQEASLVLVERGQLCFGIVLSYLLCLNCYPNTLRMMRKLYAILLLAGMFACQGPGSDSGESFSVDFEKFELENGLDVVFHIDRSDPVVAVALTAHVGSAREKKGRTGFAHLFEHLLFLESENLGKGGLDKLSARIGGSGANGSTNRDRTNYFQTVPKDALEKMIWAEADKLGWFINTVTDPVLAKEKQVVKNEKRQSIDNRPYGHTSYVVDKHLYAEDHPYNWQVIGSLEDLQNATLDDVKEFFRRWYVPNNVTLTISGDFDIEQAKEWVHKYFDEIPRGPEVEPLPKKSGELQDIVRLSYEDNFARLPELTLTWPTVEMYHPDAYALEILTQYLAYGKEAPLYKEIVEEQKLSSRVSMYQSSSELAGETSLSIRAFADKDLEDVLAAIEMALGEFEANGIPARDLQRIKAGQETGFYQSLSSVLGKGFQLAQYNIFAGDPGYISEDIERTLAVSADDVMRVYKKYIKGQPYVATSFVPRGKLELALENSEKAEVVEEKIIAGAEESFDASLTADYKRTPSTFDRTVEPPYGESPQVNVPTVWEDELENGLKVYGIESREVPLIQFNMIISGGPLFVATEKAGLANLTAEMLTRGTAEKTPAELEAAIDLLGASINAYATREGIRINVSTLARNYEATLDLVEEIIFSPRWDEAEFDLLKKSILSSLKQQQASPRSISSNAYRKLIYGESNPRGRNILGNEISVNSLTLEDVKAFYSDYSAPNITRMHVVGAISQSELMASLSGKISSWASLDIEVPNYETPAGPTASKVYFVDVPGAKQSVLSIGYPALAATDADYYPATVMNYILGGGGFASRLTQELREGKGYTYGIRSSFSATSVPGPFTISSGVRSNVTLESVQLVKEILSQYGDTYTEKDLETTKGSLIKGNARAFETLGAKLSMLENISSYGWAYDYIKQNESIVENMTVERIQELANKYANPDKMYWLIVGDAETQLPRLSELGYGDVILLEENKKEAI